MVVVVVVVVVVDDFFDNLKVLFISTSSGTAPLTRSTSSYTPPQTKPLTHFHSLIQNSSKPIH